MNRPDSYFARLLGLLPAPFLERHGREVTALLSQMKDDLGPSPSRFALGHLYLAVTWDILKHSLLSRTAPTLRPLKVSDFAVLDHLSRDTRHAVRRLRRDWKFTVVAVMMLALGIGANTAIFSVVNAVLIRPQPFEDTHQLVNIYQNGEARQPQGNSYPAYRDMTAYADVFAEVAAFTFSSVRYEADELLQPGFVEYATSTYLSVLGLAPTSGRWFREDEDYPGGEAVAVIGHQTWSTKFGSSCMWL